MLLNSHSYPQYIEEAIAQWQAGSVVAFPTETVYGLGADACNPEAVANIYALKSRPRFNPLIIHVADVQTAQRYVVWNAYADALSHFWPGPLTLVLSRRGPICDLVTAGGDTVGIRIPSHPVAQALLGAFGKPVAAPSANRSGRISPTLAAHVASEFAANSPLIIDGGACEVGLESTVVDISGEVPCLLRSGYISRAMLEAALNQPVADAVSSPTLKSPGMLSSHYAPTKPLRLGAAECRAGEGMLAFGMPPANAGVVAQLSASRDVREAATNLFAALRMLDEHAGVTSIAAMPIPADGIGEAINDRLTRAAAPREPAHG